MVSCSRLKTDVLGSLLVAIVGLILLITAIITDFWVKGKAVTVPEADGIITVNFGLFWGSKTKDRFATCTRDISVVCSSSAGVCMYSCGQDRAKEDLEDILGGASHTGDFTGDIEYCGQCASSGVQYTRDADFPSMLHPKNPIYPADLALTYGVWVSTLVFLFTGLICSILSLILILINVAHNPVSSWMGIDGLIGCSLGGGVSLALSVFIWGGGYGQRMSSTLPISDLLRPEPTATWSSEQNASLGFSYWLVCADIIVQFCIAGLMAYRQYRIYYAPRSRQNRVLEKRVKETATSGGDMLF